jgi:hypothetical protein
LDRGAGAWCKHKPPQAQAQASLATPSATGEVDGDTPDLVIARAVAAPVEKTVAGLARDVAAPVEEAGELEKVTAGWRPGGEGGRWAGRREARWRGRKAGGRARAWWRCWPSGPGAVENAEASARAAVIFF